MEIIILEKFLSGRRPFRHVEGQVGGVDSITPILFGYVDFERSYRNKKTIKSQKRKK